MRKKTLEYSSTVLPTSSPYCICFCNKTETIHTNEMKLAPTSTPRPRSQRSLRLMTLTSDPNIMGFQASCWNISMSSLMTLAASVFEILCGKTDRQTDKQTHKRRRKPYSRQSRDYRLRGLLKSRPRRMLALKSKHCSLLSKVWW